jgi:hypothetical protein
MTMTGPGSNMSPHGTDKRIMEYFAGWQWCNHIKLVDPKNMDFCKVQQVNHALL